MNRRGLPSDHITGEEAVMLGRFRALSQEARASMVETVAGMVWYQQTEGRCICEPIRRNHAAPSSTRPQLRLVQCADREVQ